MMGIPCFYVLSEIPLCRNPFKRIISRGKLEIKSENNDIEHEIHHEGKHTDEDGDEHRFEISLLFEPGEYPAESGAEEENVRGEIGEEISSRSAKAHFHTADLTENVPVGDANAELQCDNHTDEEHNIFSSGEKDGIGGLDFFRMGVRICLIAR